MKTTAKKLMAIMLVVLMFSISPLCDATPRSLAAGENGSTDVTATDNGTEESKGSSDGGNYISEVCIGMGETEAEAKSELESEGFTILTDESGALADLNRDAGSKSALKRGANDKIVYFGYKTTSDVNDAITDLAVMNMKGGYSVEDYNMIMERQMDTHIKPFVDNFIDTLEEYRANYNKPSGTINHVRADYMRKMLNLLTDDDTGGKPLGDLLLNKTKYELGDAVYDKLSDNEKKNHCDILTLLMQANGQATLTMEKLLTKAADISDDTWIDRLSETGLDDLMSRIEEDNPGLNTEPDLMAELDKNYNDMAKKLKDKWDGFREKLENIEDTAEKFADSHEEANELVESVKDMDIMEASVSQVEDFADAREQVDDQINDAQILSVCAYLETVKYEDGTLLDFFKEDLSGDDDIRRLYPVVDALSAGQIAGLDFVSLEDLVMIAMSDEEAYKKLEESLSGLGQTSVYENVNREIYEKGGVALTNDSLRTKAAEAAGDQTTDYKLGTLPSVLWGVTAGFMAASITSEVVRKVMINSEVYETVLRFFTKQNLITEKVYPKLFDNIWNNLSDIQYQIKSFQNTIKGVEEGTVTLNYADDVNIMKDKVKLLQGREKQILQNKEIAKEWGTGNVAHYLSIGFAVITVIMTVVSVVMTCLDAAKFYDVEFTPIPRYMVEESDITAINAKGEQFMLKNQTAYYKVVRCNRTAGDSSITKKNFEAMGDANDLNGDIGTQWLSLYAVKYENGAPILADSLLYQIKGDRVPDGYSTGIHEFGAKPACNLNSPKYLFADKPPEIKVYFKRDTSIQRAGAAGSLFTPGSLAIGGGVGLVLGAIFGGLVISRRKKKPTGA